MEHGRVNGGTRGGGARRCSRVAHPHGVYRALRALAQPPRELDDRGAARARDEEVLRSLARPVVSSRAEVAREIALWR
jgi:hypothetical protein